MPENPLIHWPDHVHHAEVHHGVERPGSLALASLVSPGLMLLGAPWRAFFRVARVPPGCTPSP